MTEPAWVSLDAAEDFVNLFLSATNQEVKEAGGIMHRGGTPNPIDFKYAVPDWNTQLHVLYWLGKQNEFKRNDTWALAIAMVSGLWITIGDEEARKSVSTDVNDLLGFGRDTGEIRKALGLPHDCT
jgi:hypothetical protein